VRNSESCFSFCELKFALMDNLDGWIVRINEWKWREGSSESKKEGY